MKEYEIKLLKVLCLKNIAENNGLTNKDAEDFVCFFFKISKENYWQKEAVLFSDEGFYHANYWAKNFKDGTEWKHSPVPTREKLFSVNPLKYKARFEEMTKAKHYQDYLFNKRFYRRNQND